MKISVIIPTYNRKHTLSRSIGSVISQTIKPLEIIIVDDGSTDGTGDWVSAKYPSVKYIYQKNSGVSSARNNAIQNTKGGWIAFLDSDDEWLPNKLEQQINYIQAHPEYVLCHTNEIWIRNGRRVNQMKKHKKFGGEVFEKCLDICRISPSSALIKKSIFEKIGYFDESLQVCEDYDLWLRITAKYKILFIDEPLIVKYGGHLDQLSKVNNGIEQFRIKSLEKILYSNSLSKSQKKIAEKVLLHKLKFYVNCLRKRNKVENLEVYKKKIQYWINMH